MAEPQPTSVEPHPTNDAYIRGWDGVRALAVVAVVVFHLEPTLLPGGFLGVTTFFVLAGALATTRIHREITETGAFRLGAYAGGRVRRLLPALLVYIAVVIAWVWFRRPVLFDEVAADAIAALLYVTPWRELSEPGGYAAAFAIGPQPLLHTWSLGVEEAAWILTGIAVAFTRRVRSAVVVTALMGFVGYLLWFGEADLYYSPARLAEFAVGAALGLFLLRRPEPVHWVIGAAGTLVLAAMMANLHVVDVYEGHLLLAAVASAALVAAATTGGFAAVLSTSPLRWLGTRSYSIYLWHVGFNELFDIASWQIILLTAAAAETSYRLVETPVRHRRMPMQWAPRLLGATAAGCLILALLPTPPAPFENDAADLLEAIQLRALDPEDVAAVLRATDPDREVPCAACFPSPIDGAPDYFSADVFTDADDPVSIGVIGDSTGVFLGIALDWWAEMSGEAEIHDLTLGGCSPLTSAASGWTQTRISTNGENETSLPDCMPGIEDLPDGVDLVVLIITGMPLTDHQNPDGEWVGLTDPDMQAVLETYLLATGEAARERDLPLVVANAAAMPDSVIPLMRDPARAAAFNAVLADTGLTRYDLATPLESGEYLRFDGTHLHVDTELPFDGPERNEGVRYVGEQMGPALVAYARSLTR